MSQLFDVGGHRYVKCDACGAALLATVPKGDPASLYDAGYFVRHDDRGGYVDYERDEPLHRANARRRVARCLETLGPVTGGECHPAIDVGCASGYTLDAFGASGFRAIGVDISDWALARCAELGHEAVRTLDEAIDRAGSADVVSFFQSLEHLDDPARAVGLASGVLRSGGVVIIETWDRRSMVARLLGARWHQVNPPTVLHHFTRDGLSRPLVANGFDVRAISTTSKLVSPELLMGVLTQRSRRFSGYAVRLLRAIRVSRLPIPYRAGDLITVVAVKR